jgi:DNA-binding winged helix-turn-helix (wHTH) protein/class 3 adenylate cyclase/tetratricopeptide (TPR) repeat protein
MCYHFGDYTLDTQCYELCRAGQRVPLRPKVFQVLTYLLEHRDAVVSKDALIAQVWPGQSISDETLSTCITAVRRAVGDSGQAQQVIQTRHGHGYRFVAAVTLCDPPSTDPPRQAILPVDGLEEPGLGRPRHVEGVASLLPPSPPPRLRSVAGEQKMVTVFVCLLTPLVPVTQRQAAEARHQAMQTLYAIALEEIQAYEGTLQSVQDDGFLALFGAPVAQEDHARRAVRAALGLQRRVQMAPVDPVWPAGETCPMRLGLHTGQILLGRLGEALRLTYTAVGDTTQHAAWLAQQAVPGTILVSAATGRLVHGEVRLEVCPSIPRLGPTEPGPAYQVLGLGPSHAPLLTDGARPRSRFVGRALELTTLRALLTRVTEGQGQVVGIVGEPGMGKTRLLTEFWQQLRDTRVTYLEGRCVSYGQATPYGPLQDLLRHACGLTEADSPAAITAHVQQYLHEIDIEPTEAAPLLLPLLGVPDGTTQRDRGNPQDIRTQTFATLHQLLWHERQRQPLVVAVENLHWIDPTSQDFLAELVEQLTSVPLLLLVTFRPGYRPSWMEKSYATQLTLPRLSPEDSRGVVQAVLHPTLVPEPLMQSLLAKAAGNPLFLEELAWTVREHGDLQLAPEVPATIQAVLAARIDRLPPEEKQLLQTAAVIGTEVPMPVLQAIAEVPEATLYRSLAHLHASEFLYEASLFPTHTWTFKHALTQEVAYSSLLQAGRRTLHARIVEAIEALAPERAAEQVERLAHHALRGEVWDKAVTYCQQAGAKAQDHAAFREAVVYFEQALQALVHLPTDNDTRGLTIELRLALALALLPVGEVYGQRLALLREAEALARTLDDRRRLGRVLSQMSSELREMGNFDDAIAAGRQALALAVDLGECVLQAQASFSLGQVYHVIGDFDRAAELLRQNIEAADREPDRLSTGLRIRSQAWLARTLSILGVFTEGRRHGEEALRLATLEGREATPIIAHASLGEVYLAKGDLEHAIRMFDQGLALCRASGNRSGFLRVILAGFGYAAALQGRLAEGRALLEEAMREDIRTGARQIPGRVVWLSEVYRLAGRLNAAWQHACQALDLAQQQKERGHEAFALYQLGVVQAHAAPPDAAQAAAHHQQALALAEELGMRPLQAHCHHGLGTLYAATSQREQARTALSTAIAMYQSMEMTFWLQQAETALAEVARSPYP